MPILHINNVSVSRILCCMGFLYSNNCLFLNSLYEFKRKITGQDILKISFSRACIFLLANGVECGNLLRLLITMCLMANIDCHFDLNYSTC